MSLVEECASPEKCELVEEWTDLLVSTLYINLSLYMNNSLCTLLSLGQSVGSRLVGGGRPKDWVDIDRTNRLKWSANHWSTGPMCFGELDPILGLAQRINLSETGERLVQTGRFQEPAQSCGEVRQRFGLRNASNSLTRDRNVLLCKISSLFPPAITHTGRVR